MNAIVGENHVDFVGYGCDEAEQELASDACWSLVVQLGESKLRGSIDSNEEIELSLFGPHMCNVDVEVADRISLELASDPFAVLDIWKPRDTLTLKTAVKREARQMWDRRLEGIKAIIERQQCVASKSNDDSLVLNR